MKRSYFQIQVQNGDGSWGVPDPMYGPDKDFETLKEAKQALLKYGDERLSFRICNVSEVREVELVCPGPNGIIA